MLDDDALTTAEAQLGVIARFQLLDGRSRGEVEAALVSGQLERLLRGVYRVRGAPRTPEQWMVAACLRARPAAVVTGPAVLARHRVEGFHLEHPFEVVLRPGRQLRAIEFAHREDPDPRRRVHRVGGARFATPLDAFLESAPHIDRLGERAFRGAYDRLRFRFGVREDALRRRATVLAAGLPPIVDLLALLELDGLAVESDGERRVGRLLSRFSPAPEAQVWLATGHRADWFFRDLRLVIEYQGRLDHLGASNRAADREREQALQRIGIATYPVVHEDLDRPEVLLSSLAGALALRAAKLGVPAPRLR
jgi:hypothetical protein